MTRLRRLRRIRGIGRLPTPLGGRGEQRGSEERIRNRARYEIANNTYAKGAVLTLAGDVIGTGPRSVAHNPPSDKNARQFERDFLMWAEEVSLAEKP